MNQPVQAAEAEPLFNPLSPDFIRDPYPYYHRLRTTDPVYHMPHGFLLASRHADIQFVLREKSFGKDFAGRMTRRFGAQVLDEPVYRSMSYWMLQQDPLITRGSRSRGESVYGAPRGGYASAHPADRRYGARPHRGTRSIWT